jgi:hypothetical protein
VSFSRRRAGVPCGRCVSPVSFVGEEALEVVGGEVRFDVLELLLLACAHGSPVVFLLLFLLLLLLLLVQR